MKITILEFSPCADSIYHLSRDAGEGYASGGRNEVIIRSGAKLRPRLIGTYAGGKATNVARVLDQLLTDGDRVDAELIVFRPDSPEGRYIHDLQTGALNRVRVRPVIITGQARFCIDLTDPATDPADRVQFNISPRAVWGQAALDIAMEEVSKVSSDLLLMAGNPPAVAPAERPAASLYPAVLEEVRPRVGINKLDDRHK